MGTVPNYPDHRARIASLDAFRGFAIASMVLVNNPGDWNHVHAPLLHAAWNGWTFTDLVFPFFLFIAGVSMAISVGRRYGEGAGKARLLAGIARRAAVIFLVGLALNLFPGFDFTTVRIPGVLQRIALCLLVAAPFVVLGGPRTVLAGALGLLAAYTVPMLFVPVHDATGIVAAGVLEPGRDFGSWIDRAIFGPHLWVKSRTWDPEGLASTLPAAASVLFGVLAGCWLLTDRAPAARTAGLFLAGIALLATGLILDRVLMPINKNLWTPSYCVFMWGWSLVAFAAFHRVMDTSPRTEIREGSRKALLPLTIYGMNALFLFAFSGFVARVLGSVHVAGADGASVTLKSWLYAPFSVLPVAAENASLAFALAFNAAMFAVAWGMWRMKWFVKA
jgi:predicted acyltransferase